MVAEGMAGQILFMSLKCTQTKKMFAPEPLQQQQHSSGTSLVFRNEHTKMNTISRFKFSFSHFSSAWCYRTDKKKKKQGRGTEIYIPANFIST